MSNRRRLALAAAVLAASDLHADALDDFVRAQMEKRHAPGIVYAVVDERAPVRFGAFGNASLEWNAPVGPDAAFAIGSLSKQFASSAVMLFVQEGQLRLDARIDGLLDGLPAAWGAVTVRQLLTHTSGIKGYTELPGFERRNGLPITHAELVASVAKEPLLFPAGTRYSYSNTGYYLLGMLVEKLSGLPYAEFLDRRVARPSGLVATRLDAADAIVPRRVAGYRWKGESWLRPPHEDPTWPFSGGGVLSTLRDLARWAGALRDGSLLARGSVDTMWTPTALAGGGRFPYGLGWHVESYRGRRAVWHTGSIGGFSSAMLIFPADGLTVIVLSNVENASPLHTARGIASYANPALPFVDRIVTRPDTDPARAQRIRAALAEAATAGAPPRALTPGFAAALTPAQRERAASLARRLRGLGFVTSDKAVEGTDVYGAKVTAICTYRYDLGEETLDVDHWLTADGRVAWVDSDID